MAAYRAPARGPELTVAELGIPGALGHDSLVRGGLEGTLAPGQQVGEPVDALGADDGDRQLDLIGIEASDRTVTGVHQDQRVEAIGSREGHELGHHAAHRVAEEGVPPQPRASTRSAVSAARISNE